MDKQQSVKRITRSSVKCLKQNNTNVQILKGSQNDEGTKLSWNKNALDAIAKNLFFSLMEPQEQEIEELKNAINQLQQKHEIYQRESIKQGLIMDDCRFTAMKMHKEYDYSKFLRYRHVGVQYPPKVTYVSVNIQA